MLPKTKINIALSITVVLLVMIVIYKPGKDSADKYKLLNIDKTSINHIRLERRGEEPVEFIKQDKDWLMTSPYALGTNQITVESLLDLLDYHYHAKYNVNKVELKNYKLDKPHASIIYNKQHRFEFGSAEPLNKYRYVHFNKNLYLTEDYFHHRILGAATSFLDHALIEKDLIIEKIKLPNLSLSLNDGSWTATPEPEKFSNDQANELADNWKHAHATDMTKYENIKSSAQVSLFFKDNPTPLIFEIITKEDQFYLARTDINVLYKLANEKRRDLLQLPPIISAEQLDKEALSNLKSSSNSESPKNDPSVSNKND